MSPQPFDPVAWARRKLAHEEPLRQRNPALAAHKLERMSASPFAFLRGSAPLFYELLRAYPAWAAGPPGEGWITGDLHLENFGCFAANSRVVFHINDFDDALAAPWRWDVVRVLTSLLLSARDRAMSGPRVLDLADHLLEAYVRALRGGSRPDGPPALIARLLRDAESRTRADLLKSCTRGKGTGRRFLRGAHFQSVPSSLARDARAAFARYVASLPIHERSSGASFGVLDVAFRVAGTGSLGVLRLAVLVEGHGGNHGAWMFDMKEQGSPAAGALVRRAPAGADRVLRALLTCLPFPPRMAGTTRLRGRSMLVRRLAPQEEKLNLSHAGPEDWAELMQYLGVLIGDIHRRGASGRPSRWTGPQQRALLERAVALAGAHEAVYLQFCRLTAP